MVKYSIVIPIYNASKYLEETLASILNQSYQNYEVILVNDGSTDNSLEICQKYHNEHSNIKVVDIPNSGSGKARNEGIKVAKGEYLYFPDSDDVLTENALEMINEVIENRNADLYVFAFYKGYRDSKELTLEKYEDNYLTGNEVRAHYEYYMERNGIYIQGAPWNKVFKRKIILDNNIKYPDFKRHQDEAFIVKYMNYAKDVVISSKPIYIYYLNRLYEESIKFPKNYYELRCELYNWFMEVTSSWSKEDNFRLYLKYNFAMNAMRLFELIFSKKWNLTKKEKINYIKKILNDKLMVENLTYVLANEKNVRKMLQNQKYQPKKINYFLNYLKMLKKKNYHLIYIYSYLYFKYKKVRGR